MTIDRFADVWTVNCDHCNEELSDMFWESFYDAKDGAKEAGWVSEKNAEGDWENICPGCQDRGPDFVLEDKKDGKE